MVTSQLNFVAPGRKRSTIESPISGFPSASKTSCVAPIVIPTCTVLTSSQIPVDAASAISISSSALSTMFHGAHLSDPILMHLAFLQDWELSQHQEFL